MSQAEPAAQHPADQITERLDRQDERLAEIRDALNGLGTNLQWMMEMAKPLLEMVNSPMFGSMMPGMVSAAAAGMGVPDGDQDN